MTTTLQKPYKVTLEWNNHKETLPTHIQAFAWDECHKIYLLENDQQVKEALEMEYTILPINKLKTAYKKSCGLKFINYWDLEKEPAVSQTDYRPDIEIDEII